MQGTLIASGSKNAALPIMAATLLSAERCTLHRIPVLRDIATMMTLLSSLGATATRPSSDGALMIDSRAVREFRAPYDLVKTMRASILVLGPLVARFGEAVVSLPGGCAIGARPVDLHLKALETLELLFSTLGEEQLAADAPVYSDGVFALFPRAGFQVRTLLQAF